MEQFEGIHKTSGLNIIGETLKDHNCKEGTEH